MDMASLYASYFAVQLAALRPSDQVLNIAKDVHVEIVSAHLVCSTGASVLAASDWYCKRNAIRSHGFKHVLDLSQVTLVSETVHFGGVSVVLDHLCDAVGGLLATLRLGSRYLQIVCTMSWSIFRVAQGRLTWASWQSRQINLPSLNLDLHRASRRAVCLLVDTDLT